MGSFPIVVHYPFAIVYIHAGYSFVEFLMDIDQFEETKIPKMKQIRADYKLKKFETILEDKMFNDAMRISYNGACGTATKPSNDTASTHPS
jgi:hypothetical protein